MEVLGGLCARSFVPQKSWDFKSRNNKMRVRCLQAQIIPGAALRDLNPFKSPAHLKNLAAVAALCAYTHLKPSPCDMLMKGGASHAKLQSEVTNGKYLSRKKDALELYDQIQEANKPFVIYVGPTSMGKSELLKEMCRTVKGGILYLRHDFCLQDTLIALHWELGCFLSAILYKILFVLEVLLLVFSPVDKVFGFFLKKMCKAAFGPNGILMQAAKEYKLKTGKRVICILDEVTDADWFRMVSPLLPVLLREDSPFCLVFVSFGSPFFGFVMDDEIQYKPPTDEQLGNFLQEHYKVTPEITKEILGSLGCPGDIQCAKDMAEAFEEGRYKHFRESTLKSGRYTKLLFWVD